MEETYYLTMDTPLGKKRGTLSLMKDKEGNTSGYIWALGKKQMLSKVFFSNGTFALEGAFELRFTKIPFRATGTVTGDMLKGKVETSLGTFFVSGTKVMG